MAHSWKYQGKPNQDTGSRGDPPGPDSGPLLRWELPHLRSSLEAPTACSAEQGGILHKPQGPLQFSIKRTTTDYYQAALGPANPLVEAAVPKAFSLGNSRGGSSWSHWWLDARGH